MECMDPSGNSHPMDLSSTPWNQETNNGYVNVANAYVNGYNSYVNGSFVRPQEQQMLGGVNFLNMSTLGFPQHQSQDDILSMALDMTNGQGQGCFPSPNMINNINIQQCGSTRELSLFNTSPQVSCHRPLANPTQNYPQQMSSHPNMVQQQQHHQMMSNGVHQQRLGAQFQEFSQHQHQLPPYQQLPFNQSPPQYNQLNQSSSNFTQPCPQMQKQHQQSPPTRVSECIIEDLPFAESEYPKTDDFMALDSLGLVPPPAAPANLNSSQTPTTTDIGKSTDGEVDEVVEMENDKEVNNEVNEVVEVINKDLQELEKEELKARAQTQLQKLAVPAPAKPRMMTPADAAIAKVAMDQQLAKQSLSPPKKVNRRRSVDQRLDHSSAPSSSLPSFGATFNQETTAQQQPQTSQKIKFNQLLAARIPADLHKHLIPNPHTHHLPPSPSSSATWTKELTQKLIEAKLATRKVTKLRDRKVMLFASQVAKQMEEESRIGTQSEKNKGDEVEKISPMKSLMDFASGSCDIPPINPELNVDRIVKEMKKSTEAASTLLMAKELAGKNNIGKRKANNSLQLDINQAIKYYKAQQAEKEAQKKMLALCNKVIVRKEAFEKSEDIDVNEHGPFAMITPHNSKERFRLHDLKYEAKKPEEITNIVSKKNEARYVAAPSDQRRKTHEENEGLYEVGSYLIRASDIRKRQSEVNMYQIQSKNENLLLAKLIPLTIVGRHVNIFTGTFVLTPKTAYMNYLTQNYIPVFGMSLGDDWFQGQVELHWFLHNSSVSNNLKAIQELDFKVEHFELLSQYFFRLSLYTEPGDDYPAFSKTLFEHFSASAPQFSSAWQVLAESLKQPALEIQLAFTNNSELIRSLSSLPNLRFRVIPKHEKRICSLCPTQRGKVPKLATHSAELTGYPYDPQSFQLLPESGKDLQKTANFCHICKGTARILHRVLHVMYYIKCSISSYLWGLVRELDEDEEMLDPEEVAECLLGDHEWRYGCFHEIGLMIVEAREEAVKVVKRLKTAAAAANRNTNNSSQ